MSSFLNEKLPFSWEMNQFFKLSFFIMEYEPLEKEPFFHSFSPRLKFEFKTAG
jgi:hypothetical protein